MTDKTKVIFIHGWASDSRTWLPLLASLSSDAWYRENYQSLTVDLPGFGSNHALNLNDLDSWYTFIEKQLPTSCVLVGWSLGGMLAMELARRNPDKVKAVMTLAANLQFTADHSYPDAMSDKIYMEFCASFKLKPLAALRKFNRLQTHADENHGAVMKTINSQLPEDGINVPMWNLGLTILGQINHVNTIRQCYQPKAMLFGEMDPIVPSSAVNKIRHLNPSIYCMMIPKVSHAIHLSSPTICAAKISDFLQRFFG